MFELTARELLTLEGHAAGKPIKPYRHRTSDYLLARGLLRLVAKPAEEGGFVLSFAVSEKGHKALANHIVR